MAIQGETMDGVQLGRRTREAYITTLHGQQGQLTLYRDNTVTVGGSVLSATRDDKPLMKTADEVAAMSFDYEFAGEAKSISGAELLTILAASFDAIDQASQGVG